MYIATKIKIIVKYKFLQSSPRKVTFDLYIIKLENKSKKIESR